MTEDITSNTSPEKQNPDVRDEPTQRNSYQVSVKGPGVTIDKMVDGPIALQIVAALMNPEAGAFTIGHPQPMTASKPATTTAFIPPHDATSIGEYLESLEASRNPDKIVAIGLYIKEYQGSNTFVKDDLKRYFQQAGETPPANINRDVRATLAAKWIAPATDPEAEPNTYWVTNKGAQAAAQHFSAEAQKAAPTKRGARRRASKTSGTEE